MNLSKTFKISIFFILLFFIACGFKKNAANGKTEFRIIPETIEIWLGDFTFESQIEELGGRKDIPEEVQEYVQKVGMKIAQASDRPDLPYEFVVVNNDIPNGFCFPGSKIVITKGMLLELSDESELAAVLAHEIGHAILRHSALSMERQISVKLEREMLLKPLTGTLGFLYIHSERWLKNYGSFLGFYDLKNDIQNQLKRFQEREFEADFYSIKYLNAAGYDTDGAINFLQILISRDADHDEQSYYLSTHPSPIVRQEKNRVTASSYPSGGIVGESHYKKLIKTLSK